MIVGPFLTKMDSRDAIKGSRDPLGVQALWTRAGRRLIGNLTTVTSSVREFIVTMLGYYFVDKVAELVSEVDDVETFLKWEQLAAYAYATRSSGRNFRGSERVRRRISEGDPVRLGTSIDSQILSNQKIYGLWGLYTGPTKASGLLDGEPSRLVDAAVEFVEGRLLPTITKRNSRLQKDVLERLRDPKRSRLDLADGSRDGEILDAIATVLKPTLPRDSEFYRDYLLHGGPKDRTAGLQRSLSRFVEETVHDDDWRMTPSSITKLAERGRKHGADGVATGLEEIRSIESLLAPAVSLFAYMNGCDGQTQTEVTQAVTRQWGAALKKTIAMRELESLGERLGPGDGDESSGKRWLEVARSLHAGDYRAAQNTLMDVNRSVMKSRGSDQPWIRIDRGKLKVFFRDSEPAHLPERGELREHWRHPYFIPSLRAIGVALRA